MEGHLGYINNGVEGELREGGVLKLPAGQDHTFWNKNPAALLKQQARLIGLVNGSKGTATCCIYFWAELPSSRQPARMHYGVALFKLGRI